VNALLVLVGITGVVASCTRISVLGVRRDEELPGELGERELYQ